KISHKRNVNQTQIERIAQAQFGFPRKRGNGIPQAEFKRQDNSRKRELWAPAQARVPALAARGGASRAGLCRAW
ncbi:hypothetical protein ACFY41_29085, partial [Streptomyces syringium]|uniref:hypothetical protein n=1 Tax=Streptomyces syringium TaxID=76729 RepID=UPI0036C9C95F